jgi:DNA polymerase-3 subunit beta
MKINSDRESLLKPLQLIGGVVERRQTLPILANILVNAENGRLHITATDLELELKTSLEAKTDGEQDFTLPARKFIDICKALPEEAKIEIEIKGERAVIKTGRSRFTLGMLPAQDYPNMEATNSTNSISLPEGQLKGLLEKSQFAMAQQDVRYYLNGMLLEREGEIIRTVATDGHRLAMSEQQISGDGGEDFQVILPRKAVLELSRMLTDAETPVQLEMGPNHIRIEVGDTIFTSKLIDGKFPDYQKVIPSGADKEVVADREEMRMALQRTSILSNEKYRGIRFSFKPGVLGLLAHNPEQEEAEEEMEIEYSDEELAIGFNVGYLLDVLTVITADKIKIRIKDESSSCLIEGGDTANSRYVVMPMRL